MIHSLRIMLLSVLVMGLLPVAVTCGAEETQLVRAKIGIQVKSGERESRARAKERLHSGDLLRVFVHPEESSYVYVVHSTDSAVTLLNMTKQQIKSTTLILPSIQSYYEVDGKSVLERITIVCSPRELDELRPLVEGGMSAAHWAALSERLQGESSLALSGGNEPTFALAGNVRGVEKSGGAELFARQLQIYSGKGLLVKQYEFQVR